MTQKDDMTGNDIYHRLEAYVDGETSPEEKREIERCLQESEACQARVDELRALSGAVRDESSADKAPADLWARIEERLPAASESAGVIRPAAWWHDRMRPLALAASVVLALGIGGGVAWWQGQIDYVVVAAPVQDFAAYRLSGRDLDVESSDPGVIGAWFEERLTFELPRVNASIAGFDLVGGRLCGFLDRRISALTYERGDQKIAVYVMADHDLSLPEASFAPALKLSRSVHEIDDVKTMIWHHDGLVYSVVSDLREADLSVFLAALARHGRQSAILSTGSIKKQDSVMTALTAT